MLRIAAWFRALAGGYATQYKINLVTPLWRRSMTIRRQLSRRAMLLVLHPVFALTGAADAITGPMLPSLARAFALSDSESGILLFAVFLGMALGALLCRGNYARIQVAGLMALTLSCIVFPWISRPMLYPFSFFFGVSTGTPMTAISLFAGRNYPERRAATLTLLNFSWSLGALLAPLLAARLLAFTSWHAVYYVMAGAAALATVAASLTIRDTTEIARSTPETTGLRNLRLVGLFAAFFFLEVGMESMFGAWITTYLLRVTSITLMLAAAATAIYWAGFLISRAISPLLMLRLRPGRLLALALLAALSGATLLITARSPALMAAATLLLGAALAPVFPVALAAFFERARHSSDTRFVLAVSGFGASVFPGLVGWISAHTGSLRAGMGSGPVTLLAMIVMLPLLSVGSGLAGSASQLDGSRTGA